MRTSSRQPVQGPVQKQKTVANYLATGHYHETSPDPATGTPRRDCSRSSDLDTTDTTDLATWTLRILQAYYICTYYRSSQLDTNTTNRSSHCTLLLLQNLATGLIIYSLIYGVHTEYEKDSLFLGPAKAAEVTKATPLTDERDGYKADIVTHYSSHNLWLTRPLFVNRMPI